MGIFIETIVTSEKQSTPWPIWKVTVSLVVEWDANTESHDIVSGWPKIELFRKVPPPAPPAPPARLESMGEYIIGTTSQYSHNGKMRSSHADTRSFSSEPTDFVVRTGFRNIISKGDVVIGL